MSGGSRSRERKPVRDDEEEMTIKRWLNRREDSGPHAEPPSATDTAMKAKEATKPKEAATNEAAKDSSGKIEVDNLKSSRDGACGILSNRKARDKTATDKPVKESPIAIQTPQTSVGATKKVQFSEDDVIQVMSPQPKGTPFVKPGRCLLRDLLTIYEVIIIYGVSTINSLKTF